MVNTEQIGSGHDRSRSIGPSAATPSITRPCSNCSTIQDRLRGDIEASTTRVIVLTGAPPAFCAGADLTGVEEGQFATDLGSVLRNFTTLAAPVVAAIDGPALGAGTAARRGV